MSTTLEDTQVRLRRKEAVHAVKSKNDWDMYMNQAKEQNTYLIADFGADWCKPCKLVAPFFEELSGDVPQGVFVSIDIDEAKDLGDISSVAAVPAFQVWDPKEMKKISECIGADKNALRRMVYEYCSPSASPQAKD